MPERSGAGRRRPNEGGLLPRMGVFTVDLEVMSAETAVATTSSHALACTRCSTSRGSPGPHVGVLRGVEGRRRLSGREIMGTPRRGQRGSPGAMSGLIHGGDARQGYLPSRLHRRARGQREVSARRSVPERQHARPERGPDHAHLGLNLGYHPWMTQGRAPRGVGAGAATCPDHRGTQYVHAAHGILRPSTRGC